ncbi:MAG: HlyD family efflux transporter periplasmic adaptor subunit [Tissierellia bacterium]|nr:HlyD family efflux transporter periplasmic adaptor subunit [Tissierellia bacterium]
MARKNFGLKNFFLSFALVIIAIYVFQNFKSPADFMVAENGILEDVIEAEGIVVKDENVYSATLDGSVLYYYEEGTKIKEGQLIADINTDVDSVEVNRQIAEIQSAIDNRENSGQVLSQENFTAYQNELQISILNNELQNMYSIVEQMTNNDFYSGKYDEYSISQLNEMKINLSNSISTHKVPYYSDRAGIITYKTDGLEDDYKFENVMDMTPSSTVRREYSFKDKKETVQKDESFYKIIRNFEYYIVVTVNNEKARLFEENKYIKVRILSDGEQHIVWGLIKKINYGSEESVLVLYFDDYFYKVYDKRYVNIELITAAYEGLKIKNEALMEINGMKGVYVKDASNIIKFFPVEIQGSNEEYSIVFPGDYVGINERNIIIIGEKRYHTIKIFDKVILEPDKVYEGQIAD